MNINNFIDDIKNKLLNPAEWQDLFHDAGAIRESVKNTNEASLIHEIRTAIIATYLNNTITTNYLASFILTIGGIKLYYAGGLLQYYPDDEQVNQRVGDDTPLITIDIEKTLKQLKEAAA